MFDIKTVTLLIVTSSIVALAQFLAAKRYKEYIGRAMKLWAVSLAVSALGNVLLLMHGSLPDFLSRLLANMLILAGLFGFYAAVKVLRREDFNIYYGASVVGLGTLAFGYFLYFDNNVPLRIVLWNISAIALLLPLIHSLLVRVNPEKRISYWATGALFSWVAIVLAIRVVAIGNEHFVLPAGVNTPIAPSLLYRSAFIVTVVSGLLFMLMASEEFAARIAHLASRDSLTNLYNRRAFDELADQSLYASRKAGDVCALLTLDIDAFKTINDRYGHAAGDLVLKKVTETITGKLRTQDIFGRYGGEEFNILLPGTSTEAALLVGERLRQAVQDLAVVMGEITIRLTVSIGLVIDSVHKHNLQTMLVEADRALYQAKAQGRNRVVLA